MATHSMIKISSLQFRFALIFNHIFKVLVSSLFFYETICIESFSSERKLLNNCRFLRCSNRPLWIRFPINKIIIVARCRQERCVIFQRLGTFMTFRLIRIMRSKITLSCWTAFNIANKWHLRVEIHCYLRELFQVFWLLKILSIHRLNFFLQIKGHTFVGTFALRAYTFTTHTIA